MLVGGVYRHLGYVDRLLLLYGLLDGLASVGVVLGGLCVVGLVGRSAGVSG